MIEPIAKWRQALRRFTSRERDICPEPHGYHTAQVPIGHVTMKDALSQPPSLVTDEMKLDPRWPTHCACGYVFQEEDTWQIFQNQIYAEDNGKEHILREAPPGAMWDATWLPYKGPDGKSLAVQTPAGTWQVDGPSYNRGKKGPGWTRTGTAPNITVKPSIGMTGNRIDRWAFHAFLTNGKLVRCSDSVV